MAFITADRVYDTSSSTGTGSFVVSGTAPSGYRTFSAVLTTSDTFYYAIQNQSASEWEVGLGTWSGSNTFARTTLFSSSTGSFVSFSAGTKDVVITLAASKTYQEGNTSSGVPTGNIMVGPGATYLTTAASSSAGTATVTFSGNYTIPVGATVTISGLTPSGFNGSYTVTASSAGSVSFANATAGPQTVAGSLYMTPAGYLRCDGTVYLRSSYPTLAALIGTPVVLATPTSTFVSTASAGGSVYQAGNTLFMFGSTGVSGSSASTANALYTSPDGTNWTLRTGWSIAPANPQNEAVAYNGTTWAYIPAQSGNPGQTACMISSTSISGTWTKATLTGAALNSAVTDICIGGTNNLFCIVVTSLDGCSYAPNGVGPIFTSTNGTSWTAQTSPTGYTSSGYLVGCAGYYVSGSNGGIILGTAQKLFYSANGNSTYTDITSSALGAATSAITSISYANGQFIATVTNTGVFTSTTGASGTWSKVSTNPNNPPYLGTSFGKIRWNGTIYVHSIGSTIYYSTDLINWNNTIIANSQGTTAVLSSKFWGQVINTGAKYVYSVDSNSYTTSTQFPTPVLSIGTGASFYPYATTTATNASVTTLNAPGGYGGTVAIIKT